MGRPWEIYEVPLGYRLQFPNTSLEIAQNPSRCFNHPMRRAVLSTFLFVAILGLGCMGVAVSGKADGLKHPIKLGAKTSRAALWVDADLGKTNVAVIKSKQQLSPITDDGEWCPKDGVSVRE